MSDKLSAKDAFGEERTPAGHKRLRIAIDNQGSLSNGTVPYEDRLKAMILLTQAGHDVVFCTKSVYDPVSKAHSLMATDMMAKMVEAGELSLADKQRLEGEDGFVRYQAKFAVKGHFDIVIDDEPVQWCQYGVYVNPNSPEFQMFLELVLESPDADITVILPYLFPEAPQNPPENRQG